MIYLEDFLLKKYTIFYNNLRIMMRKKYHKMLIKKVKTNNHKYDQFNN
jgi:hypothetical protein